MRASDLVTKALTEAGRQLALGLSDKKPAASAPSAGPEYSENFDFSTRGVLPRKKGAFRYSYGRLVNPTTWHGDNIVCNQCGHEFDPAEVGEVAMGAVACPKCHATAVVDRGRS